MKVILLEDVKALGKKHWGAEYRSEHLRQWKK